jgi:Tol biopolymer transport system component
MSVTVRRSWRLLNSLLVLALLMAPAPLHAVPQVSIKISHPLTGPQRVLDFRISPDGSRILYRVARSLPPDQDNPPPPPADLFSAPATGGAAVQINPPATQEQENIENYQFSPDGSEVIFTRAFSDAVLGNVFAISRAPVTGGPATAVSGPIAIGTRNVRDFVVEVEPATVQFVMGDGSVRTINTSVRHSALPERISSITDGTSNTFFFGEQVNNLLQFPYEGTARRLNPSLTGGGAVYDFAITPDGTRAIYRADQNLDGAIELFSVPADGSDAGFRISGPLVAGGDVLDFQVNAASTRAVYRADQTTNGVAELYSARTNGGIVAKLNAPLTLGGEVKEFVFSPDGSLVLYLADQDFDEQFGLYAVATTGGSGVTTISSGFAGRSIRAYRISPDGDFVYMVDAVGGGLALFRRPLALGGAFMEALPGPPVASVARPDFKFSATGSHLVYLADAGADGRFELASMDLASNGAVTVNSQINGPLPPGGNIRAFQLSPDGQRVVYAADQNTAGVVELFTVPIGGGTVERVNGPLVPGGSVRTQQDGIQFSPDGRAVYYLADQETMGVTEIFAAFDAPALAFTQNGYVVAEDGSLAAELAVARSGALVAPSSVRVQLTGAPDGGAATGGASAAGSVDFADNVRDVVFAAGEISKTFTVAINPDGVAEPAEEFNMQLFEPLTATIGAPNSVQVTILDTAGAPLLEDRTYQTPENRPNGTVLAPLRAAPDATNVVTYAILSGNTFNAFRVDAAGALVVNNSAALDFESSAFATLPAPGFKLLVEARSDTGSVDTATWRVNLTNVEEPPNFLGQTRSIAENSPNGRLVGALLSASDPERGPITFTLSSSVFAISTGGQLSVKNSSALDFETTKSFDFVVTVTDRSGLNTAATVRVNVTDVTEGDPTAPAIDSISPGVAIVGGKSFKLVVTGRNFTANSVVRWSGSNRSTILSNGKLIAVIPSGDINTTKIAAITVRDSSTGKISNSVGFIVKFALVGIAALEIEPAGAHCAVGQTTVFNLEWTHTTEPWRAMNEMDLRLIDDERIPLWVRYQETRDENGNDVSTVILLNADGTPAGSGRFGEARVIENDTVRIDLAQTSFQGSGETGSNLRVRIPVIFKQPAVQDEPYAIEMYGVDDLGGEQGPNQMGEWTVTNAAVYLPAVQR